MKSGVGMSWSRVWLRAIRSSTLLLVRREFEGWQHGTE